MTTERIYIVEADFGEKHLVQATTQAQALRHVAANRYSIKPASALETAQLMADHGMRVQKAGASGEADEPN